MAAAERLQERWAEALMACRDVCDTIIALRFLIGLTRPSPPVIGCPILFHGSGAPLFWRSRASRRTEISWLKVRDCEADFIVAACCGQSVGNAKTAVKLYLPI